MYKPVRTCATCRKPGPSQKCPCGTASYCGAECQKASWNTHRGVCTIHLSAQAQAAKNEHGRKSVEFIIANYKLALCFGGEQQTVKSQKMLIKCLEACHRLALDTSFDITNQKLVLGITECLSESYSNQHNFRMEQVVLEQALVLGRRIYDENDDHFQLITTALQRSKSMNSNDSAVTYLEEILSACRVDDDPHIAFCNTELCGAYQRAGKTDLAMDAGTKALKLARQLDDQQLIGDVLTHLAIILIDEDKLEEAICHLEEALPTLRITSGEKSVDVATVLAQFGRIYKKQGKQQDSLKMFQQSLRYIRRGAGDTQLNVPPLVHEIFLNYCRTCQGTTALELLVKEEDIMRHILTDYDKTKQELTKIVGDIQAC
jgi:tetratricopeptide (TPR) repeat protein